MSRGGQEIILPANWQPDGIIFTLDEGDPRAGLLQNLNVPAVRIGGEWDDDLFPAVSMDLLTFARQALRHYERLSCSSLLFVAPGSDSQGKRLGKLIHRLAPKFDIRIVSSAYFRHTSGRIGRLDETLDQQPEIGQALRTMPRPFGIIALRENDAVFMRNACREIGLRVPQDAGVLSGADTRMVQFTDPPISALTIDHMEMGRRAVDRLLHLMNGKTLARAYDRVPVSGVNARASTLGDSPLDQSIERVRQMINNRACEGITVEEILGHLDMSRPTLEKRYRELTGMSPAQHIRQLRAARARELLTTTNLSVTSVARRIGFDDPRPFMVFFKREFGKTPGAYRTSQV